MNEFKETNDYTQGNEILMKGHENATARFAVVIFERRFSFHFQALSRCLGTHGELFTSYFTARSCINSKISPF